MPQEPAERGEAVAFPCPRLASPPGAGRGLPATVASGRPRGPEPAGGSREGSGRAGAEGAAPPVRERAAFPSASPHTALALFTDSLRNISSAPHAPRSSPAELSSSSQHLLRERKASAPSHSSQPTLFTFEPALSNHVQPALSASAPQEYLYLHQCISRRAESTR